MDGLTVSTANSFLKTGRTVSELNADKMEAGSGKEPSGKSFAATLKDAVMDVNTLQKKSDHMMQELATGKSKNIPEVLVAAEKADIAFKLMVQVRNKLIDAYQEILKMQV